MKATVTPINPLISLQLDVAIVSEALILHRLRHLPKNRCNDWLRGLLVQGFQRECRVNRKLQRAERSSSNGTQAQNVVAHPSAAKHQSSMLRTNIKPHSKTIANKAPHFGNTVSFAALRKVIG